MYSVDQNYFTLFYNEDLVFIPIFRIMVQVCIIMDFVLLFKLRKIPFCGIKRILHILQLLTSLLKVSMCIKFSFEIQGVEFLV